MCRFSDAGIARLSTRSGGRRLKSAKGGEALERREIFRWKTGESVGYPTDKRRG